MVSHCITCRPPICNLNQTNCNVRLSRMIHSWLSLKIPIHIGCRHCEE